MKSKVCLAVLLFASSTPVLAAEVLSAKMDKSQQNILIDVQYGGGCKEHKFELKMGRGCAESFPVQCRAELVDKTSGDFCEALVGKTVSISLQEAGLTDSYFDRARLTITGDNNSSATLSLPAQSSNKGKPDVSAPATGGKKIACVTNAGSALEINPQTKAVQIETNTGNVGQFTIVSVDSVSIETFPAIDQTTYKLNDGRSIVIEFQDGSKTGTGYYIRLGGDSSPQFKSCMKVR